MARGTPEQFKQILTELVNTTKKRDAVQINHVKLFETLDYIFTPSNYGWTKEDFYKELNVQLGIIHNQKKERSVVVKPKAKKAVAKKAAKKKPVVVVLDPNAQDAPEELPF
jgi:hypothetical protein